LLGDFIVVLCHPKIPSMLAASENHLGRSLDYMLDAGVLLTCVSAMSK
jgi:hypothetical protein